MKHSGWRKPTSDMCVYERHANSGDQEAVSKTRAFAAAKKVAAHFGLSPGAMVLLDLLAAFSKTQDWEDGNTPIVWPSNSLLMEQTGFSRSALKRYIRTLAELGFIQFHDSPNGKRWGKRDAYGDIVEAYGFDLTPLAVRAAEFEQIHHQLVHERSLCKRLRREITALKRTIAEQIVVLDGDNPQTASNHLETFDSIVTASAQTPQDLTKLKDDLERLATSLRNYRATSAQTHDDPTAVCQIMEHNDNPMGSTNEPQIQPTKKLQDNNKYTAAKTKDKIADKSRTKSATTTQQTRQETHYSTKSVSALSVLEACPNFAEWHRYGSSKNDWNSLANTALKLAPMIAISPETLSRAISELGSRDAATAMALLTEKVTSGTVHKPDAYLTGMLRKARCGELNLSRSINGFLYRFDKSKRKGQEASTRRPPPFCPCEIDSVIATNALRDFNAV